MNMKMQFTRALALLTTIAFAGATCAAATDATKSKAEKEKPLVQIALLLDTSGSMEGLIEQAKSQLWRIVNEFAKARQDGIAPEVQVALRIWQEQPERGERLGSPDSTADHRPGQAFGGIVRAAHQWWRGILRLGHPGCVERTGVESVRVGLQGHFHRRQ